jgi:hypothetical protein
LLFVVCIKNSANFETDLNAKEMENIIDITEITTKAAYEMKVKMTEHLNAAATHSNFHLETRATFMPCATPDRMPDYTSDSGSQYWYEGSTVIRCANHWGVVASCVWGYNGKETNQYVSGVCELSGFERIRKVQPVPTVIEGGTAYKVILMEKRKPVATMTVRSNGKFHVMSKVKFALALLGNDVLESLGLSLRCSIKFA